jgi:dual specificity tyrosine-phosphorylation-regulated kinase 2/3/4
MNDFRGISSALVRHFAIQILVSLSYMKEHQIVNCDLKPENILLRKPNKSGIKLIDFGSGCFEQD